MERAPSPSEIRALRGERSRAEFAALVGVTPLTVYRWELADDSPEQRRPRGKVLERLRAWMQGLPAPVAAPEPAASSVQSGRTVEPSAAIDLPLREALTALDEARLEDAEGALMERLAGADRLDEASRARAAIALAKVQLLLRHDARGAFTTLLAAGDPARLPRDVQLELHLVTGFLHAHPDGRLFNPGKVHHHAALAEALLDAGGADARFFLWFVRYHLAVGIHEAALIARALDSFPAVRNLPTTPLNRVLVAEAEALGSLTLTNLAEALARVETLRRASDAARMPMQQMRARSWRAEVLVEECAPPEQIFPLLDEADALLRRHRAAVGIHVMHMNRNRGELHLRLGRLSDAEACLDEAARAARELAYTPHRILNTLAKLATYRGEPGRLRALGEAGLATLGVQRELATTYGRMLLALEAGTRGESLAPAMALLGELRRLGIWAVAYRHAALHALTIAASYGPLPEALRLREMAERAVDASPSPSASAELRRLKALVLSRCGRHAEARQLLDAAMASFDLASHLPERALVRWQVAVLEARTDPSAEARVLEAVDALAALGMKPPPVPADDEAAPVAVRYTAEPPVTTDTVGVGRLVVPIQRLSTRGVGASMLERELLNVVSELWPGHALRLEEVDSNGGVTELATRPGGAAGPLEHFELGDGAGRRLRLGIAGALSSDDRAALQILVACAALGLEVSSLRGFNGKPHPRPEVAVPAADDARIPELIAASPSMRTLKAELGRLSASRATIIVTGESGTGKEVVARALHQLSRRADRPYVTFNAAAVPRELFEGQLFGYRKGAFTGATADHPGVIRAAEGGTLFLDEVGELPLDVQPKLLRFLENGEVFPLGERQPVQVDVRVIAATHRDLALLVKEGRFREDLYYRLQVIPVRIPPLRERPEDVVALARFFIARMTPEGAQPPQLTPDGERKLLANPWRGNVRELRNVIERSMAFDPLPAVLTANDLRF